MRTHASIGATLAVCAVLSACVAQPRVATEVSFNYEGLRSAPSERFETAQFRPGIDFTQYRGVQLLEPELEFRRPDRTQQEFPLTAEQKDRFRDLLSASFHDAFAASATLATVTEPAPDVLTLEVRVIDIVARVPANSSGMGSRGSILLDATGQVTLVLEINDSESGAILARGVETRQVRGAAMRRDATMLTTWEDVERLVDRWAEITRSGVEDLITFDGS